MSDQETLEKSLKDADAPESPLDDFENGAEPKADDQQKPDVKNEEIAKSKSPSKPTLKSIEYSDDPDTLQEQLGLLPTTIVLAKVKGYRAWPAMVLAYEILPENIKSMRPKSVKQAKKQKQPVIVVPVRFFSDDTYIWIKSADLKLLSLEEIKAFLDKRANAKKHDTLIDAYKLAQDPPEMAEFNRWGSAGPPPEVPDTTEDIFEEDEEMEDENEEDEVDEDDIDEPPRKKLKLKISMKKKPKKSGVNSKTSKASAKSKAAKSTSKSKATAKSKASSKATKSKAAKSKEKLTSDDDDPGYADYEEFERELDESSMDSEPEYDSDWGVGEEDFDFETGDYIFDDENEQKEFSAEFPRAKELSSTLTFYNKQLLSKYRTIAPVLLDEVEMNEKTLLTELREVEKLIKLGEVPKVAFSKSRLFRVLLLSAHKPQENFPYRVVRGEIDKILKLMPLNACSLTLEDLVVPTPEETPAPEIKNEDKVETTGEADGNDEGAVEEGDEAEKQKGNGSTLRLEEDPEVINNDIEEVSNPVESVENASNDTDIAGTVAKEGLDAIRPEDD
ncbi:CIC11C00000003843 [Sungouiella intermedia]|uniref:CIC11C00000003843 n=1 Tax=Sungouiella intermedia TaxID=45354 RepID=A0A1L0BR62_9ASCO|nr:CIC11C00000003843 [[Candida] intermedia]